MSQAQLEPTFKVDVDFVDGEKDKALTPELRSKHNILGKSDERKKELSDMPKHKSQIQMRVMSAFENENTRGYVIGAGGLIAVGFLWYAKNIVQSNDKWLHIFAIGVVVFAVFQVEQFLESSDSLDLKIEEMLQQAKTRESEDPEPSDLISETSSAGLNIDDDVF